MPDLQEYSAFPTAFQHAPPRADGTPEGLNLSQLLEWQRCRYRWHLRYRRQVERRGVTRPLDLGSAVHAGLAGAIRARTTQAGIDSVVLWLNDWLAERIGQTLSDETITAVQEVRDTAIAIVIRTVDDLNFSRWRTVFLNKNVPLIEHKLSMPFLPDLPWYGTADWVAEDLQDGGVWVIDFKVRKVLQPPENEDTDLQLPSYQTLLAHHGIATVGAIKMQILARDYAEPELLKSGKGLSKQRIATTWDRYRQAIEAHGFDPADYTDMPQKLDVEFFRETRLYRNPRELQSLWENVITPAAKLMQKSKTQVRHLEAGLPCTGCWAKNFCVAELRLEDTDFLLATQYQIATDPAPLFAMKPSDFTLED